MAKIKILEKSKSKDYPPVKLYLDDIEKLINIFESNNISYTLTVNDEYVCENLTDLKENEKSTKIKSLKIHSNNPYITIDLNYFKAALYADSDKEAVRLFYILNEIIINKKKRPYLIHSIYFGWIILVISLLSNVVVYFVKDKVLALLIGIFSLIALPITFFNSTYQRIKNYSTIYLTRKDSQSNFFKRHKDQIILILITGIVVGFCTAAFFVIREHYFPPKK